MTTIYEYERLIPKEKEIEERGRLFRRVHWNSACSENLLDYDARLRLRVRCSQHFFWVYVNAFWNT